MRFRNRFRTMHLEVSTIKTFAIKKNICHIHVTRIIVLRVLVVDLPAEIGRVHDHVDLMQLQKHRQRL